MSLHSLPVFLRLAGRPVILVGTGEAAAAKRRVLERAGAHVVEDEDAGAALAIVVDDEAACLRLRARGVLVNAVDRPELCDFTLPAIVERGDVIVAVGTGGTSAGLAAALRQRLETWLPAGLGDLARHLHELRARLRAAWPDGGDRRRAIGAALAEGGPLDPLAPRFDVDWIGGVVVPDGVERIVLRGDDPDLLTLRDARLLAGADRVYHDGRVAPAILDRARADAERIEGAAPAAPPPGRSVVVERAA